MKYLKHMLFFLLLLFPFYVKAATGFICDLDEVATGIYDWDTDCTHLKISSMKNISFLENLYSKSITGVIVENVVIDDISLINKLNTSTVEFKGASVNFDNISGNFKKIKVYDTNVVNDDFSGLANLPMLEELSIYACWVRDLSSLTKLSSLENLKSFSFYENMVTIVDLKPIMFLNKLEKINLSFMEHNVTEELLNFFNNNSIKVSSNINDGPTAMKKLLEVYDSLELDSLSDDEQIKKISLYIINNITYGNATGTPLLVALNGSGVCAHYSLLTNVLLELAGFSVYSLSGYVN